MTAADQTVPPGESVCWCCGGEFGSRDILRLGQHPEVGVCLQCARFLQRRAVEREDELHPSPGARARAVVRRGRDLVISHGWQQRPIIGQLLRRIDRYLP
ncbi:hypothetical protein OHA70_13295 [Kribbella sp. NBC_00382]|uniref:hypothetical protein n=1 Tax=Kribbella sp. NBC_00382 TaxID=2975967 RepID=UPI002E1D9F62